VPGMLKESLQVQEVPLMDTYHILFCSSTTLKNPYLMTTMQQRSSPETRMLKQQGGHYKLPADYINTATSNSHSTTSTCSNCRYMKMKDFQNIKFVHCISLSPAIRITVVQRFTRPFIAYYQRSWSGAHLRAYR
jgi:hypothetical protein